MIRFLCGALLGAALVLLGHGVLYDKINFWRYMGQIDGQDEVFEALAKEFGVRRENEALVERPYIFSHKASALVAVEVRGVKTLRVLP